MANRSIIYIYSYNKVCDYYGITERLSDKKVSDSLGIKLDELLPILFPWANLDFAVAELALKFSIEYILSHPDECCFERINEVFQQLSKHYELYLVSNCPRPYADTFLQISGITNLINCVYTIEDGLKQENIKKIAKNSTGKLLFVGDSDDDYEALTDHYNQYFCFAKYGYKTCYHYDFAINNPKELIGVVEQLNIKERQSKGTPYRTFSYGENQLTLIEKSDTVAYFGFVNYADENFDNIIKELKAYSNKKIIGPIDFNTFYSYRFAIDNFDWNLFPDCSGEKALPLFLNNGFKINKEYSSGLAGLDYRMWEN